MGGQGGGKSDWAGSGTRGGGGGKERLEVRREGKWEGCGWVPGWETRRGWPGGRRTGTGGEEEEGVVNRRVGGEEGRLEGDSPARKGGGKGAGGGGP